MARSTDRVVGDLPRSASRRRCLVFNDTRVIPARLAGRRLRDDVTVSVEATLHRRLGPSRWTAFMRPGKRLQVGRPGKLRRTGRPGLRLDRLDATIEAKGEGGEVTLAFDLAGADLDAAIAAHGVMPLPPYIAAAGPRTSATAPTIRPSTPARTARSPRPPRACISRRRVAGAPGAGGYFDPLRHPARRRRHLPAGEDRDRGRPSDARRVRRGLAGRRRRPECDASGRRPHRLRRHHLAAPAGERRRRGRRHRPFAGETAIFITPGYRFRAADGLMTNFHLPKSTLFMLVCAFSGVEAMRARLRPRHRDRLSLLFLRRRQPALARRLMAAFPFTIQARDGAARTGVLSTPRGDIRTPAFMPVGTAGTVKALTVDQVSERRRRHHPRQHLPPDAAARRRAGGAAGRPAPVHALGRADPDRLRRLPGDVAVQDRQGDARRR